MHLLAAISYHGFGHTAQTAPVVNALRRLLPDLRVTVQSAVPHEFLRKHFRNEFTHVPIALDLGMVMHDAWNVDAEKSIAAYAELHRDWDQKVEREARRLREMNVDAVFANVPYVALAAAARAQIPAIALCSLNWADIYAHYLGTHAQAPEILGVMRAAYRAADVFLQPEPSMPMSDLPHRRGIGPIARVGQNRRDELIARLGLRRDEKLVAVALGGITTAVSLARWPRLPGIRWLVQSDWDIAHPDAIAWDTLGLNFIDALASSDAFITKPGYGSFAEAACNAVPVLYIPRNDWPEEPYLVDWLRNIVPCAAVDRRRFERGDFAEELMRLLQSPKAQALPPSGIEAAADVLLRYLR